MEQWTKGGRNLLNMIVLKRMEANKKYVINLAKLNVDINKGIRKKNFKKNTWVETN